MGIENVIFPRGKGVRVNCREPLKDPFPTDPSKMTEEEKQKRIS